MIFNVILNVLSLCLRYALDSNLQNHLIQINSSLFYCTVCYPLGIIYQSYETIKGNTRGAPISDNVLVNGDERCIEYETITLPSNENQVDSIYQYVLSYVSIMLGFLCIYSLH